MPTFNCLTDRFRYSFFSSTLNDWFNLGHNIKNSESISISKSNLLSFILPVQTNIFNIFDPKALIFLTRLRLVLVILTRTDFNTFFMTVRIPCGPVA